MKINSRLIEIFHYLEENNHTSMKAICNEMDLSERSVRYEIDNINYILSSNHLHEIEKGNKGKLFYNPSKESLELFQNFQELECVSKEERVSYFILHLLVEGKINITKMTEEMEVSRSTVKNDLKTVEELFLDNHLTLINNSVQGKEQDIRVLLLKNYNSYFSEFYVGISNGVRDRCKTQQTINYYLEDLNLSAVKQFIKQIADHFNCCENNMFQFIFSYIMVSILRIQRDGTIAEIESRNFLKSTSEYAYINQNIYKLELELDVMYTDNERLMLTDYFLGFTSYVYNTSIFEQWIVIKILVNEIIVNVDKNVVVDIRKDDILLEGLLNHIKPTIYRLKNNLCIENEFFDVTIDGCVELMDTVKSALAKLETLIGKEFPQSEVALFTIYFLASIKRNENKSKENQMILLVCGGGYGTSTIVKNVIEENYNGIIVDHIASYQLLEYDRRTIDLIISTVHISETIRDQLDIPVALITPFFTFRDDEILSQFKVVRKEKREGTSIINILQVIKKNTIIKDEHKLVEKLSFIMNQQHTTDIKKNETLFDDLIVEKLEIREDISDWKKSVERCGDKLLKSHEIEPGYIDDMFHITETFGAYFVIANNIAIPHGQFNVNVNTPCMSMLYIRNGVFFPGEKLVKLVILIASSEKNILIETVKKIHQLSQNKRLYEELEQIERREALLEYLQGQIK